MNVRRTTTPLVVMASLATFGVGVGVLSAAPADPVPGTGANITWLSGTAGDAGGTGTFECGVSATLAMDAGDYNSGLAFPVDWSTVTASAGAFTEGIEPVGSIAILADATGNAGTISFSAEVTDPVVLVNYVDPGAEMDFSPNAITVLASHSDAVGSPTVAGSRISLSGSILGTENEGWAVKVSGTFGPTSGPLPLVAYATSDATFALSVASATVCPAEEELPTTGRGTLVLLSTASTLMLLGAAPRILRRVRAS